MASKRLKNGKIDPAVLRINGSSHRSGIVHEVKNAVSTFHRVLLLVKVIEVHQVDQRNTLDFFTTLSEVTGWYTVLISFV